MWQMITPTDTWATGSLAAGVEAATGAGSCCGALVWKSCPCIAEAGITRMGGRDPPMGWDTMLSSLLGPACKKAKSSVRHTAL